MDPIETVREQVETAYADAGPQRDDDFYSRDMRCLSFLTTEYVTPSIAADIVAMIGPYNGFNPESAQQMLGHIANDDPDALVAIGREGSPVLYVETDHPERVMASFRSGFETDAAGGAPNELWTVDPEDVGNARRYKRRGEYDKYAHTGCSHARPPVEPEDYAEPDPDRAHVRAWWD